MSTVTAKQDISNSSIGSMTVLVTSAENVAPLSDKLNRGSDQAFIARTVRNR
jgi:hypothetical protein